MRDCEKPIMRSHNSHEIKKIPVTSRVTGKISSKEERQDVNGYNQQNKEKITH